MFVARVAAASAVLLGLSTASSAEAAPAAALTSVVSVAPKNKPAKGQSYAPSVSRDGRFVAFDSAAENLVKGDANGQNDVFVRDQRTKKTVLVSVSSKGKQGDDGSFTPSISGDGRWVAFVSDAKNLVPKDTNNEADAFLHDRRTGKTIRLSTAIDGRETTGGDGPQISRDGRFVVYNAGTPLRSVGTDEDLAGMFVYNTGTGERERLGQVAGGDMTISGDGRYVAFASGARDLVPDDTNRKNDCFVFDRKTRTVTRVSLGGTKAIGNGWYRGSKQAKNESTGAVVSDDGRYVAFVATGAGLVPRDTNKVDDVFVRDLKTGATRRVSVGALGRQSNGVSGGPSMSADGQVLVYLSAATNLVPGDTTGFDYDVFRIDLRTGEVSRVNVSPRGAQADGPSSSFPEISSDGRAIVFGSRASNLVAGDVNGNDDVFVRIYPR
ncbi:MAG: TolB family protein [Sporichthyaceae bacterium]